MDFYVHSAGFTLVLEHLSQSDTRRGLGTVQVRGRIQPVDLYEVVNLKPEESVSLAALAH